MKKAVRVATCLAASSATSVACQPSNKITTASFLMSASNIRSSDKSTAFLIPLTVPRGGGAKKTDGQGSQKPRTSSRRRKKKKRTKNKKKDANGDESSSFKETRSKQQRETPEPSFKSGKESVKEDANSTPSVSEGGGDNEECGNTKASNSRKPTDPLLEQIIKEDDFYKILGVPKSATEREILKAYRRRCVKTHPDKTGDRRAFDKVSEAYDTLSDLEKRKIYDRFGKAGLDGHQTGGGPSPFGRPDDLFRSFFGQSGDPFGSRSSPINRTVRYQLEVTLEELYQGLTKTIVVDNYGSRKEVEVHIPRGSSEGQGIVLSGEMDFVEGQPPADLMFLISERRHPVYTRKNHDLAIEMEISLREALCGVDSRTVKTLDGRTVCVATGKSKAPIRTGDVFVLPNEGMPKREQEGEHGDLYVQFQVSMPSSAGRLSEDERQQLSTLLGKMEGLNDVLGSSGEGVPRNIVKSSASDFGRASGTIPRPQPFQQDQDPFGGASRSSFFYSSAGSGRGHENVQCKQM